MDYYWLVLVALIISLIAQAKVSSTFSKYSKVMSKSGLTGYSVAQKILQKAGINDVQVLEINTNSLGDHYDPSKKVIKLSNNVYSSNSVAAIGVAAHECGHAIQHKVGYVPNKLRTSFVPMANIGSTAAIPLFLIGMLADIPFLRVAGIVFFAFTTIFYIITLPVEFNASIRAVNILNDYMDNDELSGVKNVLSAAAFTYLASVLMSLAQLIRLMAMSRRRD